MAKKPKPVEESSPQEQSELAISPEKVCFVIIKAREFDAKDIVMEPDTASNPSDDRMIAHAYPLCSVWSAKTAVNSEALRASLPLPSPPPISLFGHRI